MWGSGYAGLGCRRIHNARPAASDSRAPAPVATAHNGCHANISPHAANPHHGTIGDARRCPARKRKAAPFVTEYQTSVNTFVSGITLRKSRNSETTAHVTPIRRIV